MTPAEGCRTDHERAKLGVKGGGRKQVLKKSSEYGQRLRKVRYCDENPLRGPKRPLSYHLANAPSKEEVCTIKRTQKLK